MFVNKYFFFLSIKKSKRNNISVSSVSVQSPTFSEALRHVDNILILMGMQSTGSQDPRQKSRSSLSIHMSVARLEMLVNVHWNKRFWDWSPQPDWTVRMSLSSLKKQNKSKQTNKQFLSHIVVLVGVLFVTFHIVPVNKRLYSFLQISRLE